MLPMVSLRARKTTSTSFDRPLATYMVRDLEVAPRDTTIETLFDPTIVCLPSTTPFWVVAGRVSRLDVRRVVVCKDKEPIGVVAALDFARWLAW